MAPLGPFTPLVAVGCSGGPDSLALTRLSDRWARAHGGGILALIVEHGLRSESAAEAEALAEALGRLGILSRILPLGLPPGPRLQERARTARRAALLAACAQAGAPHLLLGHHAEDQYETILFRALRGSGARGLAGMAPLTVTAEALILRPLLGTPKARLAASLEGWGPAPIQDPSNQNARFARARLRAAGAGKLSAADAGDPSAAGAGGLCATGAGAAAASAFAGRRARHATEAATRMARSVRLLPEGCADITREALGQDATARRVMAALIRCVGGGAYAPAEGAVAALLERGSGTLGGARWLPGGRWLVREAATGDWVAGLWDGRFRCAAPPDGHFIGALGPDAAVFRSYFRHLPATALAALPALRRIHDGKLALVPHLSYDARESAAFYPLDFAPLAGPVTDCHPLG